MTEQWVTAERDLLLTLNTLEEYKASDILALDLRKLSDATDFFVLASGSSDTHVRALGERIIEAFAADGRKPHHEEGLAQGRWVLLDFIDFVVHVFHPTLRQFYQLERLWAEAPSALIDSPR